MTLEQPTGELVADFPTKTLPLFKPAPYKVMYGGRGGAKTWTFCRAALILGAERPLFILFARELQKSINESVHRTLATQLGPLGLADFYTVQSHRIIGKNGTQFVFAGIKNNINAIKSMESIDICAVIEANGVSSHSWDTLLPTIRRDPPHGPFGKGSEIWVEFNPELATDETYKRWVLNPPEGTTVIEINWRDNEWFPEILRKQKEEMRKRDYENYLTIFEGKVRRVVRGSIYAKELEAAMKSGRVSPHVHLDKSRAVDIGVDLGRADTCALWFVQQQGLEHWFIDYYSNVGYDWSHYLEEIQGKRYRIGRIYLPHDARHETIAAKKSIEAQTKDAYPNDHQVIVVERTPSVVNDINAVRLMFSRFTFNEKTCADGLQALAHYKYDVDEENKDPHGRGAMSPKPLHDWACVTAETEVLTRDGLKCISTLPETGEVLTPCGWKSYRLPRITRRNAPLVEVTFVDGLKVSCTAEHLFMTVNGWKSAKLLQPGMQIQSSLTVLRSILTANYIGFGRASTILRAAAVISTLTYGKRFLASVREMFISTTAMAMWPITGLRTSNACLAENTCALPINSGLPAVSKLQVLMKRPENAPLNGTNPQPDCSGISDMRNEAGAGKSGSEKLDNVSIVGRIFRRLFEVMAANKSSAPRYARQPIQIASVRPLDERKDVWCLTIDDGHWWSLANGAVVHNSHGADALRCYAMGLNDYSRYTRPQKFMPHAPPPSGSIPRGQGWMV